MLHLLKRYFLGLTLSVNVVVSAILGGDPTVTVSARAADARDRGAMTGKVVCKILDILDLSGTSLDGDHCAKAQRHRQLRLDLGHHEDF